MTGTAKKIIDQIIQTRSRGHESLAKLTRTRILLKGIDPDNFDITTPDNPQVIDKLKAIAKELEIELQDIF